MAERKLTPNQEKFTLNLFKGMYQRDAYIDAYHPKYSLPTIDGNASRLANNEKVLSRRKELEAKVETKTVATVLERKERLTEIVRANVPGFVNEDGSIKGDKDTDNVGAIQELTTRESWLKRKGEGATVTNIKLHNPIQAIAELNKMEHVYETNPTLNIDNRSIVITIVYGDTKKTLTEVIEDAVNES